MKTYTYTCDICGAVAPSDHNEIFDVHGLPGEWLSVHAEHYGVGLDGIKSFNRHYCPTCKPAIMAGMDMQP